MQPIPDLSPSIPLPRRGCRLAGQHSSATSSQPAARRRPSRPPAPGRENSTEATGAPPDEPTTRNVRAADAAGPQTRSPASGRDECLPRGISTNQARTLYTREPSVPPRHDPAARGRDDGRSPEGISTSHARTLCNRELAVQPGADAAARGWRRRGIPREHFRQFAQEPCGPEVRQFRRPQTPLRADRGDARLPWGIFDNARKNPMDRRPVDSAGRGRRCGQTAATHACRRALSTMRARTLWTRGPSIPPAEDTAAGGPRGRTLAVGHFRQCAQEPYGPEVRRFRRPRTPLRAGHGDARLPWGTFDNWRKNPMDQRSVDSAGRGRRCGRVAATGGCPGAFSTIRARTLCTREPPVPPAADAPAGRQRHRALPGPHSAEPSSDLMQPSAVPPCGPQPARRPPAQCPAPGQRHRPPPPLPSAARCARLSPRGTGQISIARAP